MTVRVDATERLGPIQAIWPFFGYDELNYAELPEGQALLADLSAGSRVPVQIRNHFWFNSGDGAPEMKWGSTNVYTEDDAGNPVYDWTRTDQLLDTLTSLGTVPFVELGFMPEALSSHPKPYRNAVTTVLNGGCFYPPNDYAKWGGLVGAWARHAQSRYPEQAERWLWELWNEPDSPYWHGTFEEFARLYDYTEAALHDALPQAKLGGPAVVRADGEFLRQFLQHCAAGTNAVTGSTGTRLDMVTFHAKGGLSVVDGYTQLSLGNQLRLHRAGFETVASFAEFADTPIFITEADPDGCAACPASYIAGAEYRLSPAYGAYELAMMKRTLELQDLVGVRVGGVFTWAFTFPGTPHFAGYRVLRSNGIDLPVLAAFNLLGQLEGERVALFSSGARELGELLDEGARGLPDIDGMATISGSTVRVLLWNYHDALVTTPAATVRLTLKVPADAARSARVSERRVDPTYGNAPALWREQGMPEPPSAEQRAALQEAMKPAALRQEEAITIDAEGELHVDLELPRFGVSLFTIALGD